MGPSAAPGGEPEPDVAVRDVRGDRAHSLGSAQSSPDFAPPTPGTAPGSHDPRSSRSYNHEPRRPCPQYFLYGGLTSGCVLPARRGRPLEIDVRRGVEPVFHRKGLASAFRE